MKPQSGTNDQASIRAPARLRSPAFLPRGTSIFLLTAVAALLAVGYVEWRRPPVRPVAVSKPALPAPPPAPQLKPDPDAAMRVYRESIVPLLDEFDRRNEGAVQRALVTLQGRMLVHKAGVVPFARDVRSWRTRFGVLRRYPSDLWHKLRHDGQNTAQVTVYVDEKFRRHVLSEDKLQQDVSTVLKQFQEDLAANRNRLYSQMSLPLSKIKCEQPITGPAFDQFRREVELRGTQMSRQLAPDTVVAGIAEFSASWMATDVAQAITSRLVAQILARVGTSMAVEGISAGGATVGGGAAGGGAGSFAGPAGTIIGIGVGIAVGAAVDWWLSAKFEAKIIEQCDRFLATLEKRLRDGGPNSPGLRQSLEEAARVAGQSQRQAIEHAMQEIKPR